MRENLRATLSRRGPRQPLVAATKFRIRHWCQPPRGRQRGRAPFRDCVCVCGCTRARARMYMRRWEERAERFMNGMFPRQVWRERHPCVPRVNTIIPTFPFIRSTPTKRGTTSRNAFGGATISVRVCVCTYTRSSPVRPRRYIFYFSRARQPSARLFKGRLESLVGHRRLTWIH